MPLFHQSKDDGWDNPHHKVSATRFPKVMASSSFQSMRIRPSTAHAVCKAVSLLFDVDVIDFQELQAIRAAMTELTRRGELPSEPEDKLVTQEQVADALNIGLSTLKRLLASGQISLPRKTVGGAVRYRWRDVVAWMNAVDDDDKGVM